MLDLSTSAGSLPVTNGSYSVSETPLGTTRHLRIVTIGAGASGINMIRTLRENLTDYEHIVYEKNSSIGGTWYENRYPGCKCDIPAHNYQFSWRHNPSWSTFFAGAQEIEKYLCTICEEENFGPSIKTLHHVKHASWDGEKGTWELQVQNLETGDVFSDYAHFLLDATGILNHWKWPQIDGIHNFKGDLIHSANWPKDLQYSGKRVAVLGNGSSGVQIVPAYRKVPYNLKISFKTLTKCFEDVKELIHCIRSPLWVVPPQQQMLLSSEAAELLGKIEMKGDEYTPAQIEKFQTDPEYYLQFVKTIEEEINSKFPVLLKDSQLAKYAMQMLSQYMKATLGGDERLSKALIPTFPVGCRRLTPAPGYLESLTQKNVRVVTESIVKVVPTGLELSTGEVIEVDAIVCATGFDVSFCPRFPIIGNNAQNLQDLWKNNLPRAYMSSSVPGYPNYFTFLGPNAPIGHGSVFTITEHVAKYIVNIIRKCQTENIKSLAPSEAALDDYYEHLEAFMPRTAWAGTCRSWFKDGRETGPVTAVHPGSRIHWFHMLEQFRGEDFVYTYEKKNRFAYLGNGFSTKELGDGDKTWYLGALKAKE
ncbi:putative sterigmatocystin biosynthesis monooxygenase [Lachnellula suecica]|uniref:Putative sterigmatocystin biosynthesis monooxygenase n=1 Tax=Lachnellula suecica TaxID=602035 RepID=A0A8T9CBL7_9HELO|nr:putative sterigmatocystin biosynthesis monooxygenase [Lachnellula suecica]